ncbi:MAG TPA: hypothetical protein VK001_01450 [Geminicoccaceae bacterium]|nr:hypothetical protein [Geminicoccaceae bacterium]
MRRKQLLRSAAILVLVCFLVACTTTRTVDLGAAPALAQEVRPGDRVAIITGDGRELAFEVVRVEDDVLVGATERVPQDEIARLEVTHFSPWRTAGMAGGGALLGLAVAGLVFVAVAPAIILGATP